MNALLTRDQEAVEGFRKRLDEVNGIKDKKFRELRLSAILTDMESCFNIPIGYAKREAFKIAYPGVMELYAEAANARW